MDQRTETEMEDGLKSDAISGKVWRTQTKPSDFWGRRERCNVQVVVVTNLSAGGIKIILGLQKSFELVLL